MRPRPVTFRCGFIATLIRLQYALSAMEHFFNCPSCGAEISMVLDLSVHHHTYVEDCEVCCNPLEISYTVEDEVLQHFEAQSLD